MVGGKKLGVLVGCNYPNTGNVLHGCHNDVMVMRDMLLLQLGFDKDGIEVLVDKPGSKNMPTGANIKQALNRMIDRSKPGDVLFFFYSGHGTVLDHSNKTVEAIVPCDFNLITCLDFRRIVDCAPKGVTFTMVADSCNSGGLIDKEAEQIGPGHPPRILPSSMRALPQRMIPSEAMLPVLSSLTGLESADISQHQLTLFGPDASVLFQLPTNQHPNPLKQDQGVLLSACQSNEETLDGRVFGLFTENVARQITSKRLTNREMVINVREAIGKGGYWGIHPCLYCSNKNADAEFLGYPKP